MRDAKLIKAALAECTANREGKSERCPFYSDGQGCCEECNADAALKWVLGGKARPGKYEFGYRPAPRGTP